ncbi:transcriptional regulator [Eggerthella sp. YY7918]|uniref:transcriptional regulator n=1 Tax=Eggerthella sp. (strain YY7918) TaxID=502558 RepID=UPI000217109D|nr:transcriptional regulator [Eggerthella sp. YY7918]BAK43458.1 transcriptional regulator [Eggerthella sp. YY7918]
MGAKDAKKYEFAATFMRLVAEAPFNRRVSVVDITNAMGCEHKTFYYYFENIGDLIIWIFRASLKKTLETQFAGYPMAKPHPDLQDPYADWPFYVRLETEGRFLAQGPTSKPPPTIRWTIARTTRTCSATT